SDQEAVYLTFQTPPYSGPGAPDKVKAFAEKFKAKYKSDPAGYDIYGYDFANIVANAIVKAGSTDKEKIIDTMHKSAVPGLLNPEYRYEEKGDSITGPLNIYRVDRGKLRRVERWKEWGGRGRAALAPDVLSKAARAAPRGALAGAPGGPPFFRDAGRRRYVS